MNNSRKQNLLNVYNTSDYNWKDFAHYITEDINYIINKPSPLSLLIETFGSDEDIMKQRNKDKMEGYGPLRLNNMVRRF
jgi:hypothetical protein